jgi:hypothetical protein
MTPATPRLWPPAPDNVVGAFIRHLNDERSADYAVAERPDTKERTKPDIDYVLRDRKTGHELAVEVSSIWRSSDAGMEDAYIDKWFARVRAYAVGRVPGVFHVTLPISVPHGMDADAFARTLTDLIVREADALASAARSGKRLRFDVGSMSVWISKSPVLTGSDVQYARSVPEMTEFPNRVRACLDDKAPKLQKYAKQGIETWIVVYNTMWPVLSPFDVVDITTKQCGPGHAHVTHIGVIGGGPPDDAWVTVVR